MVQKYRRMKDEKPEPELSSNLDFAKEKTWTKSLKSFQNFLNWETLWAN